MMKIESSTESRAFPDTQPRISTTIVVKTQKQPNPTTPTIHIGKVQVEYIHGNKHSRLVLHPTSPFANPLKKKINKTTRTNGGLWCKKEDQVLRLLFFVEDQVVLGSSVDWDLVAATLFPHRTGQAVYARCSQIARSKKMK